MSRIVKSLILHSTSRLQHQQHCRMLQDKIVDLSCHYQRRLLEYSPDSMHNYKHSGRKRMHLRHPIIPTASAPLSAAQIIPS